MSRFALRNLRRNFAILALCLAPCMSSAQSTAADMLSQGRFAEALALTEVTEVTADIRPSPDTVLLRGFAYLGLGRTAEAQAAAEQAKLAHNQFLYMMLRGHIAAKLEQLNIAAFWYRRAYDVANQPDQKATAANFARTAKGSRKWVWGVEFGVRESNNLNLATTADTVELGGVPFTLADAAKAQSGTTISAAFSGKYKLVNTANSLLQLGAVVQVAGQSGYGVTSKSLGVTLDGQRLMPSETGAPYVLSYGASVSRSQPTTDDASSYRGAHFQVSRVIDGGKQWTARLATSQNGPDQTDVSLTLGLAGQTHDGLSYSISTSQERTLSDNANVAAHARTVKASAQPKFDSLPFTMSVFAEYTQRSFDRETPFFGGMRSDELTSFGITVAPREYTLVGMAPSLTLRKTTRASNIDVNDATSVDVFMGLRNSF